MTQLLINADDFGLHPSINEAIAEGVETGVINSISVSMEGSDVDFQLLKEFSVKGTFIGLHLTWVGEKWLSSNTQINSWRDFIIKYTLGKNKFLKALKLEAETQLVAFKEIGLPLDHIDGHQHLHVFPGVSDFVFEMAKANGNCRVRIPHTPTDSLRRPGIGGLALQNFSKKLMQKQNKPFYCIGIKRSGHYDTDSLISELKSVNVERLEIVAHPGCDNQALSKKYSDWGFNWEREHQALLSPEFREMIFNNHTLLKKSV